MTLMLKDCEIELKPGTAVLLRRDGAVEIIDIVDIAKREEFIIAPV